MLGVGETTDRALYADATDGGLYDGVGTALLTCTAVARCFGGACIESQTDDCGGVSPRPLTRATGVRERSPPNTVLARESGRGGDVFLVGPSYDGKLLALAFTSSASRRAICASKLDT